jgi:phage terminase large subunit-like protein
MPVVWSRREFLAALGCGLVAKGVSAMTLVEFRRRLRGRRCFIGLDLSSTKDLTAAVAVFPDDQDFDVLPAFFCPKEQIRERSLRDRIPYDEWERREWRPGEKILNATPGNVVDYSAVRQLLQDWAAEFDLQGIAYDPWNATDLIQRLKEQDGLNCVPMRQGFSSLSAPTKSLEKAILSRRLRHDGHPVLRWCMSNVCVETDHAGNLKISKRYSTERIDGAAALVMAVDLMDRNNAQRQQSYEIYFMGGAR